MDYGLHRRSIFDDTVRDLLNNATQKLLDKRGTMEPYRGPNLLTSRSPSAIESHCRHSYLSAKRKLQASRAKVRFYVAGDDRYSAVYAVSPQRFSCFDKLLAGLTKNPLCRSSQGEHHIFNMHTSHKITNLDELNSGETYVCATYEVFDQLDRNAKSPTPHAKSRPQRIHSTAAQVAASRQRLGTSQSNRSNAAREVANPGIEESEEQLFIKEIKPKLITVLRAGEPPRKSIRILLTKKNTRSFEQLVTGITDCLCPRNPIRRLFGTQTGKLVMCLADFFLADSVFIAYCMQERMNPEDLPLNKTEVKTVGAYRFKPTSAYGRVTLASHTGSQSARPKTMPASALSARYILSRQSDKGRSRSCIPGIPARPSPVPFSVKPVSSAKSRPATGHQSITASQPIELQEPSTPNRFTKPETPRPESATAETPRTEDSLEMIPQPVKKQSSLSSNAHSNDGPIAEDTQYDNDDLTTKTGMLHTVNQSGTPRWDSTYKEATEPPINMSESNQVEPEYTPVQTPEKEETPFETPNQEVTPIPPKVEDSLTRRSSYAISRHKESQSRKTSGHEATQSRKLSGHEATQSRKSSGHTAKHSRTTSRREETRSPAVVSSTRSSGVTSRQAETHASPEQSNTIEKPEHGTTRESEGSSRTTSRQSGARQSATQYENDELEEEPAVEETVEGMTSEPIEHEEGFADNDEGYTGYTEDVVETTEAQSTQADAPSLPLDTQMDIQEGLEADPGRPALVQSTAV